MHWEALTPQAREHSGASGAVEKHGSDGHKKSSETGRKRGALESAAVNS